MPKRKPTARIISFGRYTPFDRTGSDLPKILEFTTDIPVALDSEFGYVLEVKHARGKFLRFRIDHPDFKDSHGSLAKPFEGQERISDSTWCFFLGDTFWDPLEDKVGKWRLRAWIDGELIGDKTFTMSLPN